MTAALEGGEWSAARPGRTLPPGKDPVPIVQEAGWNPGPVWMGGIYRPHRDSFPERPARSSVAIPTEIPAYVSIELLFLKFSRKCLIDLSQNRGRWRALVNAVFKVLVP